jgi:hypothetical protein
MLLSHLLAERSGALVLIFWRSDFGFLTPLFDFQSCHKSPILL